MFNKILIANRGEIACRIIKTARRLGITSVAVYSEVDSHALHVKAADEAYCIGPAPATQSYLCGDIIIQIALKTGAQAIHPGYGFLSENAEFAEQCQKAGLIFIGPSSAAIRAMGSKSAAKQRMEKAGVPLIPGYHGDSQDIATLQTAAEQLGYPILIKADAGGGGKGMRIVRHAAELPAAIAATQREAMASFAESKLLLEKYFTNPRHVEMQIFADQHGNAVYLFERDCSIQRRHQKIIEEAPAPHFDNELRKQMGNVAIAAARAIHYVGAGTLEFLLVNDQFYFMEMNTRLQVEHPITEMITGVDLVEWQLRIAAGEALPLRQEQLTINGHAFEARIYAEDPQKDFLPSTGTLLYLKIPDENKNVRIDMGVQTGDKITPYYDPLLAKLIVWDINRDKALKRLASALAQMHWVGVQTNLNLLSNINCHPAFLEGKLHTGFIAQQQSDLMQDPPMDIHVQLLAALFLLLRQKMLAEKPLTQPPQADLYSPWNDHRHFRLNLPAPQTITLEYKNKMLTSFVEHLKESYAVTIHQRIYHIKGHITDATELHAVLENRSYQATIFYAQAVLFILYNGQRYQLRYSNSDDTIEHTHQHDKTGLLSPMPGKIIALTAKIGDHVKKDSALVIMEAMKMEYTLHAPYDGVVKECYYQVGDIVNEGIELLALEEIKG